MELALCMAGFLVGAGSLAWLVYVLMTDPDDYREEKRRQRRAWMNE